MRCCRQPGTERPTKRSRSSSSKAALLRFSGETPGQSGTRREALAAVGRKGVAGVLLADIAKRRGLRTAGACTY
ncbi:hypothetical protein J6590_021129 [Homalodisca vitripennis]|nr:hypothetical protein J6590_021129 [Homalodisca vitripennis]